MRLKSTKLWAPPPKKIYIFPTGHGFVFLLGLLVMVLTAATYGNNLVYLLSFILFSVFLISMVQTHLNLKNLSLQFVSGGDVSEGHDIPLCIAILNSKNGAVQDLKVSSLKHGAHVEFVEGHSQMVAQFQIPAMTAGVKSIPRVKLSTRFPLGLFYAWMYWDFREGLYVYPKPEGRPIPPDRNSFEDGESEGQKGGVGTDFREHKLFQKGDSFRHVDWKAFARLRPLMTKKFEGDPKEILSLDWEMTFGLNKKARLEQLSLWIKEAKAHNKAFSLSLPNYKLPLGNGSQHAKLALRALSELLEEGVA